uniref:DUF4283 domain-containing protein n=1 Tax=Ananas comosus var. bracteatus TaxID=296719 RepID=A0A6V7PFC0_ANACO|nr:unnamed protein product [Ananas comosus var. bracteatus]
MRLLEFVPCGRIPTRSGGGGGGGKIGGGEIASPPEKRRRRRSNSAAATWKPTLGAISENSAVVATAAAEKGRRAAEEEEEEVERAGKGRRVSKSPGWILPRTDPDDLREAQRYYRLGYSAWIKLMGLPFECWTVARVAAMVSSFRRFLRADDVTESMSDLRAFRCQIATDSLGSIPQNLNLVLGEDLLTVQVHLESWERTDANDGEDPMSKVMIQDYNEAPTRRICQFGLIDLKNGLGRRVLGLKKR